MKEKVISDLKGLDTFQIVSLHNQFVEECENGFPIIHNMVDYDQEAYGNWEISVHFSQNNRFFYIGSLGIIVSFDEYNDNYSPISLDLLANFVISEGIDLNAIED